MRLRVVLTAAVFALFAGAIAYGVLTDVREMRLQALLVEVETAEDRIPYTGLRQMIGAETVELRFWSRGGLKRVEFVSHKGTRRPAPPRGPSFAGFPVFLRPAHGAWKKRIKDYELTIRNYEITPAGQETVAGRACDVYDVRARHPGRASYRASIDRENRFPLRFEVRVRGERVFETRFKEIEYDPAFPEGTFDESRRPEWVKLTTETVEVDRLADRAGFAVWAPGTLPAGFQLRGSEVIRAKLEAPEPARRFLPPGAQGSESRVAHLNYTDGIAVLSVVQCSAESDLWKFARKFVPGYSGKRTGDGGKVVAQKFSDRGGAAYLLELEGTVVLVAGNVAADEIERMMRTFERR